MWSAWWVWALLAAVFGIAEVMAPTYILLGFAIGAGLVALGLAFGLLGALPGTVYGFAWLLVVFAVLSLVAWIALRRVFGRPGGTAQHFEDDVNDG